jgi:hypothetical protein
MLTIVTAKPPAKIPRAFIFAFSMWNKAYNLRKQIHPFGKFTHVAPENSCLFP